MSLQWLANKLRAGACFRRDQFLLLGLVPAYDGQIIRDNTLWWLAPRNCDMQSYILLAWWVLQ
jgi:hypothetical protein